MENISPEENLLDSKNICTDDDRQLKTICARFFSPIISLYVNIFLLIKARTR